MIQDFKDADTKELFEKGRNMRWRSIEKAAKHKLHMLDSATRIGDLRIPSGNNLEALVGDRAGQHSIRINKQYRLCFYWRQEGPTDVEIVDYH